MARTAYILVFVWALLLSGVAGGLPADIVNAPPITITADGNVEPSTAPIQRVGDVYTFTDDIGVFSYDLVSAGLKVLKDNIVIDGAHFSIYAKYTNGSDGTYWNGVDLGGRRNVEVKNLEIRGFRCGICLEGASGNTISGNEISGGYTGSRYVPFPSGILVRYATNNTIISNKITSNNDYGILITADSTGNNFVGNIITDNGVGIALIYCANNILRNNQIFGNNKNFKLGYNYYSEFIQDIDASNTVDGKPIYCWFDEHNQTIPSGAGFVALGNCTNITVKDLQISRSYDSITLINTNDSVIINNQIDSSANGIFLKYCQNINVTENAVTGSLAGVRTTYCINITVDKNNITNCSYGIKTDRICLNIMIFENYFARNDHGVDLVSAQESLISSNYLEKNRFGANVVSSRQNKFIENDFVENTEGAVRISGAPNNTFCHNNFINNSLFGSCQILNPWIVAWNPEENFWDNGFEGNYWNDLKQRYPNASEILGKGVWDTPYFINEKNIDHYPLVAPYGTVNAPSPSPSPSPKPQPEPFPIALVAAASIATVIVGAGLLVYFKKRKSERAVL